MSFSAVTYALAIKNAKKYTDETAIAFGGLKGAPCQVKSIEKKDGQNIVTLQWENDNGDIREGKIYIDDGTPIYNWTAGHPYKYGDLAIYASCFYRCIMANTDYSFDPAKWNEIGSSDGNYDIIDTADQLPVRFTPADRKMYYCIEDGFFYLWNGEEWVEQQPDSITYDEISRLFSQN